MPGACLFVDGGIFENLSGSHTPAVFNVSYRNQEFEDALLEEKCFARPGICRDRGRRVDCAAYISGKIAAGRPDAKDQEKNF